MKQQTITPRSTAGVKHEQKRPSVRSTNSSVEIAGPTTWPLEMSQFLSCIPSGRNNSHDKQPQGTEEAQDSDNSDDAYEAHAPHLCLQILIRRAKALTSLQTAPI